MIELLRSGRFFVTRLLLSIEKQRSDILFHCDWLNNQERLDNMQPKEFDWSKFVKH
jgi:hypothetical protein